MSSNFSVAFGSVFHQIKLYQLLTATNSERFIVVQLNTVIVFVIVLPQFVSASNITFIHSMHFQSSSTYHSSHQSHFAYNVVSWIIGHQLYLNAQTYSSNCQQLNLSSLVTLIQRILKFFVESSLPHAPLTVQLLLLFIFIYCHR